jgi:hypothetical protein
VIGPNPSALLGAIVWVIAWLGARPNPFETAWARALLLLAPLVLLPLGLRLAAAPTGSAGWDGLWRAAVLLQLPAAVLLGWAFLGSPGLRAAALAIPWSATTALIALIGLVRARRHWAVPLSEFCIDAGLVYLAIGGAWAVCDRLGVRPLDFPDVIVLLTAVHFHYAGFVLPVLTGLALRQVEGPTARLAGVGVIGGVPLVAIGITATQRNLGPALECATAWVLASAGILTAWLYFRIALRRTRPPFVRALWVVSAFSLSASMVLAALYGVRFYVPVAGLDLPGMRALHGSVNALFAVAGLVGWTLLEPSPRGEFGGRPRHRASIDPIARPRRPRTSATTRTAPIVSIADKPKAWL